MDFLLSCFQVFWIVFSPVLQLALGLRALEQIQKFFGVKQKDLKSLDLVYTFALGLLLHLWAVFLLKQYLGAPWWLATFLPLVFVWGKLEETISYLQLRRVKGHVNFLIWFFIIIAIGTTLFQAVDGIQTPWDNNYGDLTWHLGMISNFVLGDRFPIEYHIFPGLKLSYPFFVNLWSAVLWWPSASYSALGIIFNLQWTLCWLAVYVVVKGNRNFFLPWALLFAGGSYLLLGDDSWRFLDKGYPWTVFLTSVWIPQRAAMMGLFCAIAGFSYFLRSKEESSPDESKYYVFSGGLLLSLAVLVHTHFMIAACLYIGLTLLIPVLASLWLYIRKKHDNHSALVLNQFKAFLVSLLPVLLALPVILGKSHLSSVMLGWTGTKMKLGLLEQLQASLVMWGENTGPLLLIILLFCLFERSYFEFLVLALCFLIFNVIKLAAWDWDQLKLFIGLYIVFICMAANTKRSASRVLQYLCIILCIPGVIETGRMFTQGKQLTVFTKEDLKHAKLIAEHTTSDDIIAGKPNHNLSVLLSGRRLYYGYVGTLWSHGIDHENRGSINRSLYEITRCVESGKEAVCPSHIYFSHHEKRYWNTQEIGTEFEKTILPYLFKVR